MSREIFEVTKDRFHLQNPCCYILQGTWPKEAKMRAMLDGSEIKSEIQRLEVVSALERFKDPDLMRGERITAAVQLPESLEGYQKLSHFPKRKFNNTGCHLANPQLQQYNILICSIHEIFLDRKSVV